MTATGSVDALARFGTPEFRRDPYPFLRWLREHDPVHHTSKGFYLVSRHADADRVLRDPDGAFRTPDRAQLTRQFPQAAGHRSVTLLVNSLPALNDPEHTRLRRVVAQHFTPKRVDALHEHISRTCDHLLDDIAGPLLAGEVVDLHTAFTTRFALTMMCDLLGVPAADRDGLAPDASELAAALGSGDTALLREADEHTGRVEDYFAGLIARRRADPRDDLVSALARQQDQLSPDEVIAMVWVLWNVGFEGTAAAIEHGVRLLAEHPEQGHWLRGDHRAAVAFTDEVLRHTGPQIFLGVSQIATRDIELSGVRIPEGGQLRPVLAAANRDPAVFADPDRFDPARDTSRSLVFGQGAHHCLGAFLARAEIAVALRGLHRRFPAMATAGEPTWCHSFSLRAAERFPVTLADNGSEE